MKNKDENIMTLEEARGRLEEVLMTLAKNSVHEKRLLEYADSLERYIGQLEAKLAEESAENSTSVEDFVDESKPEAE